MHRKHIVDKGIHAIGINDVLLVIIFKLLQGGFESCQ